MLNEELKSTVDSKLEELKQTKKDLRKSECMECATILGCMSLLFLGDADHFCKGDNYQGVAFAIDMILSGFTWGLVSYIFESQNKDDISEVKDKIEFLKAVKSGLAKGINDYENMSQEEFEVMLNTMFIKSNDYDLDESDELTRERK